MGMREHRAGKQVAEDVLGSQETRIRVPSRRMRTEDDEEGSQGGGHMRDGRRKVRLSQMPAGDAAAANGGESSRHISERHQQQQQPRGGRFGSFQSSQGGGSSSQREAARASRLGGAGAAGASLGDGSRGRSPVQILADDENEDEDGSAAARPVPVDPAEVVRNYAAAVEQANELHITKDISEEELNKMICGVMRLMLFRNFKEPSVPVKREDVVKMVTKTHRGGHRQLASAVVAHAQLRFAQGLGFYMKEITRLAQPRQGGRAPTAAKAASASAVADAKSYILLSLLPSPLLPLASSSSQRMLSAFAAAVCCLIQGKGGTMREEDLWAVLAKLGVYRGDNDHPSLGNIDTNFNVLIKQRHIQPIKEVTPEGEELTEYRLAENSLYGIGANNLSAMFAQFASPKKG